MTPQVRSLLGRLERFGREHDAAETAHAKKMLNLDRETAELVALFLQLGRRRSVLEIGTSNGYSTIWLAASVEAFDGFVVSIDRSPEKHAMARANLSEAGLLDRVTLLTGEGTELVASLTQTFEAVFFDADRTSAPEQFRALLPKLAPDALLLADNVLSHPAEVAGYVAEVEGHPEFLTATLHVGKGLHVAYRPGRPAR